MWRRDRVVATAWQIVVSLASFATALASGLWVMKTRPTNPAYIFMLFTYMYLYDYKN